MPTSNTLVTRVGLTSPIIQGPFGAATPPPIWWRRCPTPGTRIVRRAPPRAALDSGDGCGYSRANVAAVCVESVGFESRPGRRLA